MVTLEFVVDKQVQAEFDAAMRQAFIYNKRSIGEICNSTLFFVCRNAINATQSTTKDKIRNDLLAVSRKSPTAPVAAILAQKWQGEGGRPGYYGDTMRAAVESFIRTRQAHRNYIRSRWMPANTILAAATKFKSGAKPLPSGISIRGKETGEGGGAQPAGSDWKASGYIFAVLEKLRKEDTAGIILNKGLDQAVREETESKLQYVMNKKIEEGLLIFNK